MTNMAQIFQDMSLEEQEDFWKEDFWKEDFWKDKIKISVRKNNEKEEPQKPLFRCRICGYPKYDAVYGDSSMIPLGGKQYPFAYQCSKCSVIFKDPIKFTKND